MGLLIALNYLRVKIKYDKVGTFSAILCACVLNHFSYVWLFATSWTVAHQAPLCMRFPRQEYWNGLLFPSPEDLPDPGIEPRSPTLLAFSLPSEPPAKPSWFSSVQFSSVAQSCPTLCDPMNRSTPGLPVHHQLPEFTQTHVHQVSDAIQPSHSLLSPSPPAPNPYQHQSFFPMSQL